MDVLEIGIKICRELGLPTLLVFSFIYFLWRVGINCRDAMIWSGPKFLLPVRDAFIENIAILTRFVARADEMLPKIQTEQERMVEKLDVALESHGAIATDIDDVKKMTKAVSIVIAHQCESHDCWFKKNRRTFDSDASDQ